MSDLAVISNQFGTLSYSIRFERVNRIMSLGNYARSYMYLNGRSVNDHRSFSDRADTEKAINDCKDYAAFLYECYHTFRRMSLSEIRYLLDQKGEFERLTYNLISIDSDYTFRNYVKTGHFLKNPAPPGSYHYFEFHDHRNLFGSDSNKIYVIEKIELFNTSLEVTYYDLKDGYRNKTYTKSFPVPSYFGKCVKVAFFLSIIYQVIKYNHYWLFESYPHSTVFGSVDWEMKKIINEYDLYPQKLIF